MSNQAGFLVLTLYLVLEAFYLMMHLCLHLLT